MRLDCLRVALILIILSPLSAIRTAVAENLRTYAKTCEDEIGAPVMGFSCSNDGYAIAMKSTGDGKCEKPPYLSSAVCRAGSRLGVQPGTPPHVAIVWLCRKKKVVDPTSPFFDDIAVIQTNFENGATCFYQRLTDDQRGVNGTNVPAPARNTGNFWWQPSRVKVEQCASCHDTGLLRTPYLTQVRDKGHQVLPEERHTANYWFPGEDLRDWNGRVYKIKPATPQKCTSCHSMGANTIRPTFGTSSWLGPMATGAVATPHLGPSDEAFWMSPDLTEPKEEDQRDSVRMKECALQLHSDCSLELWGGQVQAVINGLRGRKLPDLMQPIGKEKPSPSYR